MEEQVRVGAVVAGFDGSDESVRAVRWAAAEAELRNRPLLIVEALRPQVWAPIGYGVYPAAVADIRDERFIGQARQRLDAMAVECRRTIPALEVMTQLQQDEPVTALTTIVEDVEAELVAIGSSGHSALPRILLGSTAAELARAVRRPLIVVRGAPDADAPVVVGVDESQASQRALKFAFEYAELHRCPVFAVHAWSDQPLDVFEPVERWEHDEAGEQAAAAEFSAKYLDPWRERHPQVAARLTTVVDRSARALLELAESAQLLVVGSHGHGVVRRVLLGSVSHAALYHASCPVAVLRGPDEPAAPQQS
ncbi:universal stress protein [Kibdelosporangium aridum]|uniref:Universal stress protein n=1 Tax=Kibdelosporangium aridum TaxID=2030 RepID=A0A428Z3X5_KIBAR|nr:universal stress protein [Kibdelosporangium aridum]RSM80886.1 universal stress protein [Kibdelosporangium aridum]